MMVYEQDVAARTDAMYRWYLDIGLLANAFEIEKERAFVLPVVR